MQVSVIVTLPTLRRAQRRLKPHSDRLDALKQTARLRAELRVLTLTYLNEVCSVVMPGGGSHSLLFWQEFFKLEPWNRTEGVRTKLAYASETKVEFSVSAELAELLR
jgi:hypothetical protein